MSDVAVSDVAVSDVAVSDVAVSDVAVSDVDGVVRSVTPRVWGQGWMRLGLDAARVEGVDPVSWMPSSWKDETGAAQALRPRNA